MTGKAKKLLIPAAAALAIAGGGVAVANATGGDDEGRDDDAAERVTDPQTLERARAAALEATNGGKVTEVERADEGQSGYEVEVDRADGNSVEVHVDRAFRVQSVQDDD